VSRFIFRRPDALAILALVVLWLLFFWRLYTPTLADRVFIAQSDFSSQYYNFSAYQARRFDAGSLFPAWNPYNYGGSPFLADPQASVAYPVRWLFLALYGGGRWSYAALEAEVMAHFLLTSLLMYVLARRITGSALGGLISAIAYTYGGYLNSYPIQQVTILESGTWLPLALLGIHLGTERGSSTRWGWLVVGGVGLGLIVLGGHPQIAMLCGYFCVAYLVFRVYTGSRSWRDLIVSVALLVLIGGGLAAIVLLPTAEFQQLATRATDLNYASKAGGYPFTDVTQIVWSTATNLYAPLYIGIAGIALAVIAVAYSRARALFWAVAGVVALLLSFGGQTSLFQFLYVLLPGVSLFRDQERAIMLWSFCMSILAGIGAVRLIQGLGAEEQKRLRYGLYAILAVTVAYSLILYSGTTGVKNTALQVVVFDGLVMALSAYLLPWVARCPGQRQGALVALLVFDLFSLTQSGPAFSPGSPDTQLPEAPWMADMRPLLAADPFARIDGTDKLGPFGTLFALPTIRGTGPLHLAGTDRLLNLPASKTWDLLAVRYVISGEASLPVPSKRLKDVSDWSGQYAVYELEKPGPLARLIYAADVIPNDDYAAQVMAAPDYPVGDKAVLPQPPPLALGGQRPDEASVTLTEIGPERLRLRASTSANALLLVSMPYHPGWKASTGGQALTVVRADLGLLAIPLPVGQYDIALDFNPTSIQIGKLVSGITLIVTVLLLGGWIVAWRRNRPLFTQPTKETD
jgi:hypothetical protein